MKILYIVTVSNTVNAFLLPHIKMLVDKGHQVDIACNLKDPFKEEVFELCSNIFQIPFERSPITIKNFTAYIILKKIVNEEHYDIVHTHTPIASMISRIATRKITKKTKVFYTAHGFHFFKGAPMKNWIIYYPIEKWLSRYTDVLITINNEDYTTAINKKFKTNKIVLINGVGIDLSRFVKQEMDKKTNIRKNLGYNKEDYILIYVAELSSRKNQTMLINSISKLKDRIPNIRLLLVGKGEKNFDYEQLIKKFSLEQYIELLGFRDDIPELMAMSDVVVSTSKQEGLPVNIMEAMGIGLPIVATDVRGNRDLVEDGVNGYLVRLGNEELLANRIFKLYNDKSIAVLFKENNLRGIRKYSIEESLAVLEKIYEENRE